MHVVRLLAPRLDNESHTKDIDFSPGGIANAGKQVTQIPTARLSVRSGSARSASEASWGIFRGGSDPASLDATSYLT
jgi:hypothetical protein